MNKYRLLLFAVIGLMILNVVLMAALFFGRPGGPPLHPGDQGPKQLLIDRLDLTTNQVQAYEVLIADHKVQIRQKEETIREIRKELYRQLGIGVENVDSLLEQIGDTHQEIESIHYNHFFALRELCTPEQMGAFNDLSDELSRHFNAPPPR